MEWSRKGIKISFRKFPENFRSEISESFHVPSLKLRMTSAVKLDFLLRLYFLQGVSAPLVGSTIVHMEILFDASTRLMSFTFVGHNIGYTLGAWFCGIAYDRTNKEFGFTVAIIFEAMATICAAFVPNLAAFIAAMSVQGFAMGFIDAGNSTYDVEIFLHNVLISVAKCILKR